MPALGDLFQPGAMREVVRERTGMTIQWLSDGGSDGAVSWSFHRHAHGWVICTICPSKQFYIPAGEHSLPSPYQRCPHMLRARL